MVECYLKEQRLKGYCVETVWAVVRSVRAQLRHSLNGLGEEGSKCRHN
jgi:hypothetical protein